MSGLPKFLYGVVAIGVLAVGCNRETKSETTTASGKPKLKIVYIPKNTGNPYFDEVTRGFKEASKELGCTFSVSAPATADATSQIPFIKSQVQQGVDVIAISPNSPDALNQALNDARRQGVTIITVDADLVGNETHRDAAVLPADFSKIGPSQVELLGKLTGYKGDFAILSATADAPNQNAWIEGMKQALKDPKYAGMHLAETVYGDDEPQKSTSECEGLIAKHPGLRGIISPTSVGLAAAAQVVERTGVYPKGPHATGEGLQLTGLSTPNQLKKFVDKGEVSAFQLWEPYNEGYIAAHLGSQLHGRTITPAAGGTFETAKFGKMTFTEKLEIFGSPLITFDKANIGKYSF